MTEHDLIAEVDVEHRFIVTKSRCSALADAVMQPHRAGDAAQQFLDWLDSGEKPIPEHEAQAIVDVLNGASGDVRKAWRSQFNVSPFALPEGRLDEAKAFVAGITAGAPTAAELRAEADVARVRYLTFTGGT